MTRAAGLDGLRFHDLRHTYVSLLIRVGANVKEVSDRLDVILGRSVAPPAAPIQVLDMPEADRVALERVARSTVDLRAAS